MSRIKDKFQELKRKKQKALIAYVVAGYPSEKGTISAVRGLVKGGADIIELGLPFSDRLADGSVIQHASYDALSKGMNLEKFVNLVKKIRKETQVPLVLMTYTNLLYRHGYDKFVSAVKKAGIDGLILPDMILEESKDFLNATHRSDVDAIFLISPNTSAQRIRKIASVSSGFLYLVSVFVTTRVQHHFNQNTLKAIKRAKKTVNGKIPLGEGFASRNPDKAKLI